MNLNQNLIFIKTDTLFHLIYIFTVMTKLTEIKKRKILNINAAAKLIFNKNTGNQFCDIMSEIA